MPDVSGTWNQVCDFMRRNCAVVLSAEQAYLLESRLGPVTKLHKFDTIPSFVHAACTAPLASPLSRSLVDAMTTHETYFFRDDNFWKVLEAEILAKLVEKRRAGLKIWSAACSHGQEPYSLAMMLEEKYPELAKLTTIVATDVSEPAVERGKAGLYSTLEVNRGLNAVRLIKHFEKAEGGFRIKPKLRERVQWRTHNLLAATPPANDCDLVLCRNVLIYFADDDRKKVFQGLEQALVRGGALGLGTGERCPFVPVASGWFLRN